MHGRGQVAAPLLSKVLVGLVGEPVDAVNQGKAVAVEGERAGGREADVGGGEGEEGQEDGGNQGRFW